MSWVECPKCGVLYRGDHTCSKEQSSGFHVRYIDLTTGKTLEKDISDREQHDLYKLQREGKISIIEIHKIKGKVATATKEDFGIKVNIKFAPSEMPRKMEETLRNVTEIHFGYETLMGRKRIAFESDIHATGITYFVDEIEEFEAFPETEKAPAF